MHLMLFLTGMEIKSIRTYLHTLFPGSHPKIIVGMSGGIDSSTLAALLTTFGFNVIGITLKLHPVSKNTQPKACCLPKDIQFSKDIAHKFGFQHFTLDMTTQFTHHVIQPFIHSYQSGETPSPCILCNEKIKFHKLLESQRTWNAQYIATGHYAFIDPRNYHLYRGRYAQKDQSYFLFSIPNTHIIRFPFGLFSKIHVREFARELNILEYNKSESQNLCFVHTDGYKSFLNKAISPKLGNIVDTQNNILGTHSGIGHYTVGQRKGLGIGGRKNDTAPLYVKTIDIARNRIVVDYKKNLYIRTIYLSNTKNMPPYSFFGHIKFRNLMKPVKAKFTPPYTVEFAKSVFGVSPGQALVFYKNARVVGGGWITHTTA